MGITRTLDVVVCDCCGVTCNNNPEMAWRYDPLLNKVFCTSVHKNCFAKLGPALTSSSLTTAITAHTVTTIAGVILNHP